MIMGGTYEVPVVEGLLNEDFVEQLKMSGTYNEDSFDREYNSKWSGDVENAFFSSESFDKCRILLQAEHEYSGRTSKSAFYCLGVDVGRYRCTTEVMVFKVTPQPQGSSLKSLVNIYTYEAEHFEEQAINIKKLYYKYKARSIAMDINGVGAGLLDFMVLSQTDPETNDILPPFGLENDEDGKYKKYKTADMEYDAIYGIKANAPLNTEMYTYAKAQMFSCKVKFLIDESRAKAKLLTTKKGQEMTSEQRNDYLRPYVLTDILKNQMLNLKEETEGINIILKKTNNGIKKDKFSAFIYGMYYIKQEEERKRRRRHGGIAQMMFFT